MLVEESVKERYSEGAKAREEALCCPVDYDRGLLKMLPAEIVERDYGCGDPSRYVLPGDTVLDLGSGGGKICYMAAQIVGSEGAVIGIDMTDDMLALARQYRDEMCAKTGCSSIEFRKGRIQDLALDLDEVDGYIRKNTLKSLSDMEALEQWQKQRRNSTPMITNGSVDLVISNCVLNLVDEADRKQMIAEIFRVLKPGGRVAISDIVSDRFVPKHLKEDAHLWSGCISGAFQEKEFIDVFIAEGFKAVAYDKWDSQPWQVVEGYEFRSVTLVASKPVTASEDADVEVIYKGPFAEVEDDNGIRYVRGLRQRVSAQAASELRLTPLAEHFEYPGSSKVDSCSAPKTSCC